MVVRDMLQKYVGAVGKEMALRLFEFGKGNICLILCVWAVMISRLV